jgi:hypothetical protein
LERATRFELATKSLGSSYSTTELRPHPVVRGWSITNRLPGKGRVRGRQDELVDEGQVVSGGADAAGPRPRDAGAPMARELERCEHGDREGHQGEGAGRPHDTAAGRRRYGGHASGLMVTSRAAGAGRRPATLAVRGAPLVRCRERSQRSCRGFSAASDRDRERNATGSRAPLGPFPYYPSLPDDRASPIHTRTLNFAERSRFGGRTTPFRRKETKGSGLGSRSLLLSCRS